MLRQPLDLRLAGGGDDNHAVKPIFGRRFVQQRNFDDQVPMISPRHSSAFRPFGADAGMKNFFKAPFEERIVKY